MNRSVQTAEAIVQVLDPEGSVVVPDLEPDLPSEFLWRAFEGMLTVRAIDERMLMLQRQGRIAFYGAATGQEAAIIGSGLALEPQDWVFPALREVGVALLRGYTLQDLAHQLFGTQDDILKGRQMPCHYSDRRVHHVAWSSCIGNQVPQAVGAALAARYMGDSVVVMAYLGDGATSEGDFHVAMNFAAVFQAPVVFFCQNNQWAISVP
ncbi:MAG: thiamine pyrophosphate-dependent enzyme, partial [Acidobacteria bacterium]|nr:thiamine pyrophosphate-dependent enzyme [Acidobacteriota bacterium]MDW7983803.1 thiamine pyrophosphate-dependent enzyme [Acidobacteriota bacterium]